MKTLQKRAIICICFAALLVLGTGFYIYKFVNDGSMWVTYPANTHIYTKGKLTTGILKDRNGETLISNSEDGVAAYNSDYYTRRALVHTTGDSHGNISTGANIVFSDKMIGYNLITGVYSTGGQGRTLTTTIDADVSTTANLALAGRRGTVGVYNYKTGEILCMVSSPNYDPLYPPILDADDTSGAFLNRFTSSTIVPGSTFKTVTAAAALNEVKDIDNWTYNCTGTHRYGSHEKDRITCLYAHGTVDLEEALEVSCNCAFGELAIEVGAKKMEEYTKKAGLMDSYDIDGIRTKASTFDFDSNDVNLAWTGIGQSKDLVNPCAMMVYMGSIAGNGEAATPNLIKDIEVLSGIGSDYDFKTTTKSFMDEKTSSELKDMMINNVESYYGSSMFPGLKIGAKSGTAETSKDATPHAWFTGFLDDEETPYAFVVLVENGGYGTEVAGRVANTVLQALVNK